MEIIKSWVKNKEAELLNKNIFNGAGSVTLTTGEKIGTNGALQDLEDYLNEKGIRHTVWMS